MHHISITKLYKIWFSKDPNSFLGIENQLRFIREREKNPKAQLYFLYSSTCLSTQALIELKQFCTQYKIEPIDFDTQVPAMIQDPLDQKMYALAKAEIAHALSETGGNLAGAADCARLIVPIIERCGIYSDFDASLNFAALPETIEAKAPIVFPVHIGINQGCLSNEETILDINNDFIAVAFDEENPNKIHPEALKNIRSLQQDIATRYQNPVNALFSPFPHLPTENTQANLAKQFFSAPDADLFTYRRYIHHLSIQDYMPFDSRIARHLKEQDKTVADLSFTEIHHLLEEKGMLCGFSPLTRLQGTFTNVEIRDLFRDGTEKWREYIQNKKVNDFLTFKKSALLMDSVCWISGPQTYGGLVKSKLGDSTPQLELTSKLTQTLKDYSLDNNIMKSSVFSPNDEKNERKADVPKSQTPFDKIGTTGDASWTPLGKVKQHQREQQILKATKLIQKSFRQRKKSNP